jgi:hypothetical protein
MRRVSFSGAKPNDKYRGMNGFLTNIDSGTNQALAGDDLKTRLDNDDNWGTVIFKQKSDPSNSWTFPLVTGSSYMMKWINNLDFENMKVTISSHWKETDLPTFIHF